MHQEIEKLIQSCHINHGNIDISEFEMLSRTPTMIREEFACRIDLIQHKSPMFGQLKSEDMYVTIGGASLQRHRCVMGVSLIEFQVNFPEIGFPKIKGKNLEDTKNRVEGFERGYLGRYLAGKDLIKAYKNDLESCQNLSEVSVIIIEHLYLQCAQKISKYSELKKNSVVVDDLKHYTNLLILQHYYMDRLKVETGIRAKRSGLHSKGP